MANKMLIDATHTEETRVVVVRGNRVEEFDFESANRKQLRGNIYLAKVTRVEPSLQAAFIDYGGNRHGFLAFSEIHPDYYQIPVADRQALLEEEARAQKEDDEDERRNRRRYRNRSARRARGGDVVKGAAAGDDETPAAGGAPETAASAEPQTPQAAMAPADALSAAAAPLPAAAADAPARPPAADKTENGEDDAARDDEDEDFEDDDDEENDEEAGDDDVDEDDVDEDDGGEDDDDDDDEDADEDDREPAAAAEASGAEPLTAAALRKPADDNGNGAEEAPHEDDVVEDVGGDADVLEEVAARAPRRRRQYKIQEVIKRRQVMLVQVVKEERGTKGAALTTYLSLAGRYSVLMPNTARGGGISRKITSAEDRKRLKEIAEALQVPEGMGVILRTAGASRTNQEIQRDFEYLLRLWETVRDLTLRSTAPCLVYEEGSLIKRSIRDLYHKDIDEIIVEGETAYQEARDFMRMLMPDNTETVRLYRDSLPLFTRFGVEAQLDAMFQPTVQLKSGGYIVINQAEALVAIDVNSGRATREHSIEETALKTNSEAAAEIARQLRLRDLAGLIVIDFIDMDEKRNNRIVERRLKDALKNDRARIQVGRISHFGLLEMSRQRIRSSVLESSTEICPHCGGTGHVRSVSSVALQLLRALDESLMKGATHNLIVRTRPDVAIYVLNHKRAHLRRLEERFKVTITITTDPTITGQPAYAIDRGEQVMSLDQARALVVQFDSALQRPAAAEAEAEEAALPGEEFEGAESAEEEARGDGDGRRRRRRGRRGGRGRSRGEPREAALAGEEFEPAEPEAGEAAGAGEAEESEAAIDAGEAENGAPRRRRGRRGGRRNRRHRDAAETGEEFEATAPADEPDDQPAYSEPAAAARPESAPAPMAESAPAAPAAEETAPAASPRRRSTVREPVPAFSADDSGAGSPPAPAPEPEPVATAEDAADRPRRSGWWSKRG